MRRGGPDGAAQATPAPGAEAAGLASRPSTHVAARPGRFDVFTGDELLLTYNVWGGRPHIHPLMAPGTECSMTRCRPVDHPWQYAVFTGLNLVNGYDFWCCGDAVYPPDRRGHIDIGQAEVECDRPDRCVLRCEADWVTPEGECLLIETQRVIAGGPVRTDADHYHVDIEWTLRPGAGPVTIGVSDYGGLSVRLVGEPHTRRHLSSDVVPAAGAVEGAPARWVSVAQPVDGVGTWSPETAHTYAYAGVAIFDHPANPRFPNRWRVDEQGLINPAPARSGPFEISEPTRWRYRLHAFIGPGDAGRLQAAYQEWTS